MHFRSALPSGHLHGWLSPQHCSRRASFCHVRTAAGSRVTTAAYRAGRHGGGSACRTARGNPCADGDSAYCQPIAAAAPSALRTRAAAQAEGRSATRTASDCAATISEAISRRATPHQRGHRHRRKKSAARERQATERHTSRLSGQSPRIPRPSARRHPHLRLGPRPKSRPQSTNPLQRTSQIPLAPNPRNLASRLP
jgi:hypothetical protein